MKKNTRIERLINRRTGRAIEDYRMIANGDKILIGISGTDSMALLEALETKQKYAPVKYKLIAVHASINEKNEKIITDYLTGKNLEYHIINLDLTKGEKNSKKSHCFWCSWERRKAIFKLADKLKCKKVAFGHHMDDIIETYLLNIFFMGELSTMPPKIKMIKSPLQIIRPLCYLQKKHIKAYAKYKNIPVLPVECPYSTATNRIVVRQFLNDLSKKYPIIKQNILKSMTNIKKDYLLKKAL